MSAEYSSAEREQIASLERQIEKAGATEARSLAAELRAQLTAVKYAVDALQGAITQAILRHS